MTGLWDVLALVRLMLGGTPFLIHTSSLEKIVFFEFSLGNVIPLVHESVILINGIFCFSTKLKNIML